ncbi:cell division protein FtsQ/DivIB, partial [Patescibacteria group bacterium]
MPKYRSEKLIKQQRKKIFSYVLITIFFIALITFLFSLASKVEGINIKQVNIKGNKVLPTKVLEDNIKVFIEGDYLGLFSRANIAFYPRRKIEETLLENFKIIEEIDIDFGNLQMIDVAIQEREPYAVWCSSDEKCYFLDKKGFIFDEAPDFSGDVYFKYYGGLDESGMVGKYFLNVVEFKRVNLLLNDFAKNLILFEKFIVRMDGDYEVYLEENASVRLTGIIITLVMM